MEQQETEVILLLETLHIVAILMNGYTRGECVYQIHTHTHIQYILTNVRLYTDKHTHTFS